MSNPYSKFSWPDSKCHVSRFAITKEELECGEEVATCPSCSLIIKVIYDIEDFQGDEEEQAVAAKLETLKI